jgi:hypothetical protein
LYSWDYLYELGIHQDARWEDYLRRIDDAGMSRDPEHKTPAAGLQAVDLRRPGNADKQ